MSGRAELLSPEAPGPEGGFLVVTAGERMLLVALGTLGRDRGQGYCGNPTGRGSPQIPYHREAVWGLVIPK